MERYTQLLFKTKHPSWMLFVVLGLAVIAVLVFVIDGRPLATQVEKIEQSTQLQTLSSEDLTQQLLTKTEEWKQAKGKQKAELAHQLRDIAQARKTKLLALIEQNPQQVLDLALSQDQRAALPPDIRLLIEEHIDLTGSLEVLHEDDFENQKSRDFHFLNTGNQRFSLHTSDQFPPLLSSSKVRVTGVKLDDKITFTTQNTLEVLEEAAPDSIGEQRIAVILANFADTSRNSIRNNISPDGVRDAVFNRTNSYYMENSYNKILLSGDVFGWYTLPIKTTCDDRIAALNAAIVTADPDIFYPNYNRLILVFPFTSCGAARGTLGLWSIFTPDGTVSMSVAWMNSEHVGPPTVGHEFGHNLGNHHASFLNCGDVPIAPSGCTNVEYGDRYDILGTSTPMGHFNAPHKEYVGWFAASNIQTVTTSGTYTIEPIETATSGLKALKVPRGISDYLYLEYRQPIGYDANFQSYFTGSDVFDGALIHIVERGIYYPYLIDVTPPGDSETSALKLGDSFIDPATGTTVTVTDRTETFLTVDVSIGTLDSDGDGFTNGAEFFIGTDPTHACPATTAANDEPVDPWPPDFNDNGIVQIDDVFAVSSRFNAKIGDANYTKRAELASQNGVIGIDDVFAVSGRFNKSCTP